VEFCDHGNKPPIFINGGEFLDQLSDCHILVKYVFCSVYGVGYKLKEGREIAVKGTTFV
jgi:hypothetical protein